MFILYSCVNNTICSPEKINAGVVTAVAEVIEDGVISAAAKLNIQETVLLFAAAKNEQPPPIECPPIATLALTLPLNLTKLAGELQVFKFIPIVAKKFKSLPK